jgi:hypothetical protein
MLIKLSADEPSDSEFRIETAAALAPGLCIYVMLGPDMLLKVGMTDNLPRRARDLGHIQSSPSTLMATTALGRKPWRRSSSGR